MWLKGEDGSGDKYEFGFYGCSFYSVRFYYKVVFSQCLGVSSTQVSLVVDKECKDQLLGKWRYLISKELKGTRKHYESELS